MTDTDVTAPLDETVFGMWDRLADFRASDIAGARHFFLETLCYLLNAQNAAWVGAVRMDRHDPDDPLHGWRPRKFDRLHHTKDSKALVRAKARQLEDGKPDIVTIRRVALAGQFRVHRLDDLAPEGWRDGDFFRGYYHEAGIVDTMWAGIPVNADTELYLGLYRTRGHALFRPEDCDRMAFALRGLRWFHRNLMLAEGIGVASSPVTPAEQRVLSGLLHGNSEQAIAEDNGQSVHTTHDHVKRLFRKYGVGSRAELMALWLGKAV